MVEIAGPAAREHLSKPLLYERAKRRLLNIARERVKTRDHARHITVQNRKGLAIGDAEHGGRGIMADAGKLSRFIIAVGETASKLLHDLSRGLVHMTGAAVVAESRPQSGDALKASARQMVKGWEGAEESLIIGDHGCNLCLLQHDLGNPNSVGVARAAPGQRARMSAKPAEQRPAHGGRAAFPRK